MDDKIQPHPTRSSNSDSVEGGRLSTNDEVKNIRDLPEDRQGPAWELAQMSPEEYKAFEKKTLWKMDVRIIPWITSVILSSCACDGIEADRIRLLYLVSFLDRVYVVQHSDMAVRLIR
jgi:hypothetical protein